MKQVLYNIDSKQKIRQVTFEYEKTDEGYTITRNSGLVGGAVVSQPSLIITKGKASRTLDQQVNLEFNALISKARDKGYKDSPEELSSVKTDVSGKKKPMLAKDPKGKIENLIKGKKGYASKKLDGVRMVMDSENEIIGTTSRGGKSYDIVATEMMKDPCLIDFFRNYPDYQLDGEIYCHGEILEDISGAARKKEWVEDRHAHLQFWIFDILAEDLTFEERLAILKTIEPKTNKIVVVEHIEVNSYNELKTLHDKWVEEGFEGAIWREADGDYKVGGRPNSMVKMKLMQDAEFEIVGLTEGLRDEDMVFILKTKEGNTFEAKPIGTVAKRMEYLKNINELIGKMGTVKFFHMSQKGVPNLPIFKHVRPDDE